MRFLFLTTWFPYPPDNGSKIRTHYLLRALAEKHKITLLSFAFDTAQPDMAGQGLAWCEDIQVVTINPFAVNQAGVVATFLSRQPVAARPIPAMSQLATNLWQSHAFDAVIASTGMMAAYALSSPAPTATMLEEHNSLTRWMRERFMTATDLANRLRYWASWQKTRHYEARLFRQFDQVIMVSEQDRQTSERELPGYRRSVAVIPNGVDCQHNQPNLFPSEANRLVFNGALTYQANDEAMAYFLRQIYPRIKTAIPDATLVITGSTQGVNLDGLPLDESVCLTGWVEDIRQPVAQATICVVPLLQGGGTRLKILEAMALGTPVVATSKGAEGLAAMDGQHLLLADTPEQFADQVIELLNNPQRRQVLARQARQLVEKQYDWREIGQQFVQLVEDTVSAKRSA